MTNKKYEHIGRAVECVIRLNAMSDRMDEDRWELSKHLYAIVQDGSAVDNFIRTNYGGAMASFHLPPKFLSAIGDVIAREEAKAIMKEGVK